MGGFYSPHYKRVRLSLRTERSKPMATLYYRPQALETIARHILTRYDEMYLNGKPRAVPIETIIEKTFGLRIEYQYLTNDGRELGRMIYDNGITTYYDRETMDYALMRVEGGTMLIEAPLLEDEKYYGRLRFTLAHELAHYILHKRIFSGTGVAAALYNQDTDEDATEWQANYLAKAILMPNGQIKRCFYALRPVCRAKSDFVCKMAEIFEVSKQAMEIRLKEFALI